MVIPGYDPEDIDDALESHMDEGEIEELLTRDELKSYRAGNASLIDLLDAQEIRTLLEEKGVSLDAHEDTA